jgi:ABC-type sugar transport system ATPase subunit
MDLSDRILVMFEGKIVGSFNAGEATAEELGLFMAGSRSGHSDMPTLDLSRGEVAR